MTRLIITAIKYFIIGHTKTQEFFTFHSCLDKFSSEWALGLGKHIFRAEMPFNGYRSLIRKGTRKHSFHLGPLAFDEWADETHRSAVRSCGPGKGTFLTLPGGHGPNVRGAVESEPNADHSGPITRSLSIANQPDKQEAIVASCCQSIKNIFLESQLIESWCHSYCRNSIF